MSSIRSKRHRATADELAAIQARREARERGFEYRPTTAKQQDEAARMNAGFAMMEEANGEDDSED